MEFVVSKSLNSFDVGEAENLTTGAQASRLPDCEAIENRLD
jgi:hypothetical protein